MTDTHTGNDSGGPEPGDSLSRYREAIFYRFALVAMLFLAPFIVNAFLSGMHVMGVSAMAIEAVLLVNALAIRRGQPVPVPPLVVFVPMVLTIGVSIDAKGMIGVLWAYPTMLMAHFVLERRPANFVCAAVLAVMTPLAYVAVGAEITIRVFATALLTVVFANIFSTIILRLQRRLQELAIADPLTDAFNRRHLEDVAQEVLQRRARYGTRASMLLLDIDHFKRINDELGHAAGDRVLKQFVAVLKQSLRTVDRVYRLGGEEFAVLLPDIGQATAVRVAEKLRSQVRAVGLLRERPVTISIGIGELALNEALESWIRRCDAALYEAKHAGRDRVVAAPLPVDAVAVRRAQAQRT